MTKTSNSRPVHRTEILDFVTANGPCSRTEIIKFILSLKGRTYDPKKDRGYYSCAFWRPYSWCKQAMLNSHKYGYLTYATKADCRYLTKVEGGKWAVVNQKVHKINQSLAKA